MTRPLALALVMFGLGMALLLVTLCLYFTEEKDE